MVMVKKFLREVQHVQLNSPAGVPCGNGVCGRVGYAEDCNAQRLLSGRSQCRSVDERICVWYDLFFCRRIHRLCRQTGMALRPQLIVDRRGERSIWRGHCMARPCKTNAYNDTES